MENFQKNDYYLHDDHNHLGTTKHVNNCDNHKETKQGLKISEF